MTRQWRDENTGLRLDRRQHNSLVWWDIVHTASGLHVAGRITAQFRLKRDAQAAMRRLLDTGVDWTLDNNIAIARSTPSGRQKVARTLRQIAAERRGHDAYI